MRIEHVLIEEIAGSDLQKYVQWVQTFVGVKPKFRSLEVLSQKQFDAEYGSESSELFGLVAAIRTRQGDIFVREGSEDSVVHELVHAAGFLDDTIGTFFSEGFTQLVSQEIAVKHRLKIPQTYKENVALARAIVEQVLSLDIQQFAKQYAKARKKAEWLADTMLEKKAAVFANEEDWGPQSQIRQKLLRELLENYGGFLLVNQLIDPVYSEAAGSFDASQALEEYSNGFARRWPKARKALKKLGLRLVYDGHLSGEGQYRSGEILIGSKFFKLSDEAAQDHVLWHELGHAVSDKAGFPAWVAKAPEFGVDVWDTTALPLGNFNSEEAMAETLAVLFQEDRVGMGHLRKRFPGWIDLARWVASEAGVPV